MAPGQEAAIAWQPERTQEWQGSTPLHPGATPTWQGATTGWQSATPARSEITPGSTTGWQAATPARPELAPREEHLIQRNSGGPAATPGPSISRATEVPQILSPRDPRHPGGLPVMRIMLPTGLQVEKIIGHSEGPSTSNTETGTQTSPPDPAVSITEQLQQRAMQMIARTAVERATLATRSVQCNLEEESEVQLVAIVTLGAFGIGQGGRLRPLRTETDADDSSVEILPSRIPPIMESADDDPPKKRKYTKRKQK